LRSAAIWRRVRPASCSARMCSTRSGERTCGRPRVADGEGARPGRRRSATNRSSSSTGMSFVPHGISIVSISGRTRRSKVERLTPSAVAACVRVYASRSTRFASLTTSAGAADRAADGRCRCAFSVRRLRRLRDTRTEYTNSDAYLHRDASASRWLSGYARTAYRACSSISIPRASATS
jgi:hypothetical protein